MNKVDSFDSETSPFFKKKLSTPEGKKAYIEEDVSPYIKKKRIAEFEPVKEQEEDEHDESLLRKFSRGKARFAADVTESVLGIPGNLMSFVHQGTGPLTEKLTGEKEVPYSDTIVGKVFPTTQKFMEGRPDYLKPQTPGEASASEWTQELTDLMIPLPGPKKAKIATKGVDIAREFGKRLSKNAAILGTGNLAKSIAEDFGVSDENAAWVKAGTVFLGSLATASGVKGAEKFGKELYSEAKELRPKNALLDARKWAVKAKALKKELERGGTSPATSKSITKLDEMIFSVRKNANYIPIDDLEEFSRKLNIERAGLYDEFKGNKIGAKTARKNLDSVSSLIAEGIKEYGETNKPWYSKWKEAQGVHGAIEQSKSVSKWLGKNIKNLGKAGGSALVGEAIVHPDAVIPALGGTVTGLVGLKGAELISRIMKNKSLRKYYLNILDGAARKDAAFVSHNLSRLEKEIKDDPEILQ